MGNDLFSMSQQKGIYHTLSLWSRLSPHLTNSEKPEPTFDNEPESKIEEHSDTEATTD
jgi:hypothetical protein